MFIKLPEKHKDEDKIKYIEIINNNTKKVISLIDLSNGFVDIKTKEPYRIYTNKDKQKNSKGEK